MSCNIAKEQLRMYVLNLCTAEEAAATALHVQSCAACGSDLLDLERTQAMLVQAFDEEPPEWLLQKTLVRVREQRKISFFRGVWGIPAAAGVTIAVLLLLWNPAGRHDNYPASLASPASSCDSGAYARRMDDGKHYTSSLIDIISNDLDIEVTNPVSDRSIYESLDIAPEVAALLL